MQSLQAQAEAIAELYIPPDVGRPSDIGDPEVLKQFFQAIADGNYLETACHLVGLSKVTVHNWTKRGEAGESPFDRFVNAVKAAEARAEAKMVANVRRASDLPQFWAAAATHLERRHPDRWGKRNDDTQVPRVVVQIGVGNTDVKVGIGLSPSVSEDLHSLSASADSGLRPISALMLTAPATCESVPTPLETPIDVRQLPAGDPRGGPQPGEAVAGGQRTGSPVKGRSRKFFQKEKRARGVQKARETA